MFFQKKESQDAPTIIPSQNFKDFAKALQEVLEYQFQFYSSTENAAAALGVAIGEAIVDSNPDTYVQIISKLQQGISRGVLNKRQHNS